MIAKIPLENTVKGWVRDLLRQHGVWWYAHAPSGLGGAGLDFLGCHRGRFFGVETKRPGKKPTPRQEATMRAIVAAGGTVFVVDDRESLAVLAKWLTTS